MAAVDASLIISWSALGLAATGAAAPWVANWLKRKTDLQGRLNESFIAFTDRLQDRCVYLEAELSKLEAHLVAVREYAEGMADRLRHYGEEPPPLPILNGHGKRTS